MRKRSKPASRKAVNFCRDRSTTKRHEAICESLDPTPVSGLGLTAYPLDLGFRVYGLGSRVLGLRSIPRSTHGRTLRVLKGGRQLTLKAFLRVWGAGVWYAGVPAWYTLKIYHAGFVGSKYLEGSHTFPTQVRPGISCKICRGVDVCKTILETLVSDKP